MAKQTLFNISQDMQAFDDLLAECQGNLDDPQIQETLAKMAGEIKINLEEKIDNCAAYIRTLEARSEVRKGEAKRMFGLSKSDGDNANRLKGYVKGILEFNQIKKLDTTRFCVSVSVSGGPQPIEVNVKAEDLPVNLQKIKTEITENSDEIRKLLVAGQEVPGCRLLERGTHLRIR